MYQLLTAPDSPAASGVLTDGHAEASPEACVRWGKRSPSVLGGRPRRFYIVWGAGGRPVTRPYNKYIHALTDWNLKQISRGES